MSDEKLDTQAKAFAINIDNQRYGTFAEIGAGQEVVRWFFRAGGAAGTGQRAQFAGRDRVFRPRGPEDHLTEGLRRVPARRTEPLVGFELE